MPAPQPLSASVAQGQWQEEAVVQEQPHLATVRPIAGGNEEAVVEDSCSIIPIAKVVVAVAKTCKSYLLPLRAVSSPPDF